MLSPSIDRFVTQTAKICSCIAWAALAYAFFHYSTPVAISDGNHTVIPVNLFSMTALLGGFLSMACALPCLSYDIADRGAWVFVIWCSLPFLLIVGWLNPFPTPYLW